jgi:hypothetical protein
MAPFEKSRHKQSALSRAKVKKRRFLCPPMQAKAPFSLKRAGMRRIRKIETNRPGSKPGRFNCGALEAPLFTSEMRETRLLSARQDVAQLGAPCG